MSRMSAATCVAALEQADLSVTATQLVGADSDHCRGALSIDKELLAPRQETLLVRQGGRAVEGNGILSLQIPEGDIY